MDVYIFILSIFNANIPFLCYVVIYDQKLIKDVLHCSLGRFGVRSSYAETRLDEDSNSAAIDVVADVKTERVDTTFFCDISLLQIIDQQMHFSVIFAIIHFSLRCSL